MKILFVVLPVCDAWSRTLDANVQVAPMSKQGNKEMVEFWLLHNKNFLTLTGHVLSPSLEWSLLNGYLEK